MHLAETKIHHEETYLTNNDWYAFLAREEKEGYAKPHAGHDFIYPSIQAFVEAKQRYRDGHFIETTYDYEFVYDHEYADVLYELSHSQAEIYGVTPGIDCPA